MGFVKFDNGIYIAKNKEDSDILFKNLNHGILYKVEILEEVKEKFDKIVLENRKKRNGSNNN